MKSLPVRCAYDKIVPLAKLKPHPKNPNRHSNTQLRLLAKVMQHQGWRSPITVSKRSGYIVAGHARLLAARKMELPDAPIDFQDFKSEKDELAHLVVDNRIAELATMDVSILRDLTTTLDGGDFDMELTGFDRAALEKLLATDDILPDAGHAGGIEGDGEMGDGGVLSPSHIRMVQLFLTTKTFPPFQENVDKLARRYKTDNITDTVAQCVAEAAARKQ